MQKTNGKEKLCDVLHRLINIISANPCRMSDDTFNSIATGIETLITEKTGYVWRDKAANILGVSTRTLGRLVEAGKIHPIRRGRYNCEYSIEELNKYKKERDKMN